MDDNLDDPYVQATQMNMHDLHMKEGMTSGQGVISNQSLTQTGHDDSKGPRDTNTTIITQTTQTNSQTTVQTPEKDNTILIITIVVIVLIVIAVSIGIYFVVYKTKKLEQLEQQVVYVYGAQPTQY